MYHYHDISMVHFEPTQKCQASCPMCDRNHNGGDVNRHLTNADVSYDQFVSWFPVAFLQQVKHFYFCGNHGDPIFCPDLLEICEYIREVNPTIRLWVTTNGGARTPDWWEKLAKVVSHVNFSVDGLWDTNHIYRQGVSWPKVEENMDAFIQSGGKATWTFIVFNYNEHQVEQAEEYSKLLGVTNFVVKKSGRYVSPAFTQKRDTHQAVYRGEETITLSQPTNPKYRNAEIDTTYDQIVERFGSMDDFIDVAPIKPKCVEKKEIYVSALGDVFPCCWVNGQMFKFWRNIKQSPEYQLLEQSGGEHTISLKHTPLEECVESLYFANIEQTWGIQGCDNGRLKVCGMKCNVGFDPFSAQWGTNE